MGLQTLNLIVAIMALVVAVVCYYVESYTDDLLSYNMARGLAFGAAIVAIAIIIYNFIILFN